MRVHIIVAVIVCGGSVPRVPRGARQGHPGDVQALRRDNLEARAARGAQHQGQTHFRRLGLRPHGRRPQRVS